MRNKNKKYIDIKEKCQKLYEAGLTYQEIADTLHLKSHQLAQYHAKSYAQVIHNSPIAKK
jgi:hypothetical protein